MPPITVTRTIEQTFTAYEVSDDNMSDIWALMRVGQESGDFVLRPVGVPRDDGTFGTQVVITKRDGTDIVAFEGYWILVSDDDLIVVDSPTATEKFRATDKAKEKLRWQATKNAPDAEVRDGAASVTFKSPTSLNAPFTYVVVVTGPGGEQRITPTPETSVDKRQGALVKGLNVTLPLGDQPPGEYSAVVTVTDVHGRTAAAKPVTFTVPEPEPEPEPDPPVEDPPQEK